MVSKPSCIVNAHSSLPRKFKRGDIASKAVCVF